MKIAKSSPKTEGKDEVKPTLEPVEFEESPEKRIPKCASCKNHGLIVRKKNHKGKCVYANCKCLKCQLLGERRQVLAELVKLRRAEEKKQVQELLKLRPQFKKNPPIQLFTSPYAGNKTSVIMSTVKSEGTEQDTLIVPDKLEEN